MTLTTLLAENTQELKASFVEKTKTFAANFFEYACAEVARYRGEEGREMYKNNRNAYWELEKACAKLQGIKSMGLARFTEKEVAAAEQHYVASIAKLADRITKKGIAETDEVKVIAARVDVNFEMTVTFGSKTVKAWTIIAEGPINRPHYRYLVK